MTRLEIFYLQVEKRYSLLTLMLFGQRQVIVGGINSYSRAMLGSELTQHHDLLHKEF
jgi:hypothetical protein